MGPDSQYDRQWGITDNGQNQIMDDVCRQFGKWHYGNERQWGVKDNGNTR